MPHYAPFPSAAAGPDQSSKSSSKERYRALFEKAPDAYIATDRVGQIQDANEAAVELLARDLSGLIGATLEDFVDPADRPVFAERIAEMIRGTHDRVVDWNLLLCPDAGGRVRVSASVCCDPAQHGDGARIRWQLRHDPQRELFESDLRGAVILAEERERSKLSQDLHDDLSQVLALVAMRLGSVRDQSLGPVREEVLEIEDLVRQASDRTSSLTFQLHPPVLKSEGLVSAARWLADDLRRHYGLHVKIETLGEADKVPEPTRIVVFRSLRELLVNVAKHAATHEALVTISRLGDGLQVVVVDRGVGFEATADNEGYGLRSIRERVHYLGGDMHIESEVGVGTKAQVSVPLAS